MAIKLAITDMQRLAESRGGKCLSTEYVNQRTKLRWQCREGHTWEARARGGKKQSWCPYCAHRVPLTIEEMQRLAESRGGRCLSNKYFNIETKLKWQCKEGHIWEAKPGNIKKGAWCPHCAKKATLTIQEMQKLAESRGGKCLSEIYFNNQTKLKWQCKEGHIWEARPDHVKNNGSWCPICCDNTLTIEKMYRLAESRGGKCLSKEYFNNKAKLKWRCKEGHIWEARAHDINSGRWCPYCAKKATLTIQEMQKLAESRGGKCLSQEYFNNSTKLKWQCSNGHIWDAQSKNIKRGGWCPDCGYFVMENICRQIFCKIFKLDFPKQRPAWLKNKMGNLLELDGYNEKLSLAFEYQGEQHYNEIPFFSRKKNYKYNTLKERDIIKRQICESRGIKLIEIPFSIKVSDLYDFILNQCTYLGIKVPPHELIKISELKLTSSNLLILKEIAKKRGGELLSDVYAGIFEKHLWRCKLKHTWESTPSVVKQGAWCPRCSNRMRLTIAQMQEIAESHGGRCLSEKYIDSLTKLKWECKEGHVWETKPTVIRSGSWCPYCAKKPKLKITIMQEVAQARGGKCLSTEYVNPRTKLKWQCKEGHTWEAVQRSVKDGSWCPYCARKNRLITVKNKAAHQLNNS